MFFGESIRIVAEDFELWNVLEGIWRVTGYVELWKAFRKDLESYGGFGVRGGF